ncbi:MAG: hypothetical protein ACJ74W_21420 [Pyrinomonadaceae bacterium]
MHKHFALPPWLRCTLCAALLSCFSLCAAFGQTPRTDAQARAVAARFAPIFYQGLGDQPRHDYITNFDFDGNWRGDDNWAHVDDEHLPLKAYIYYAVSETATHYFIHYAVFHPRDYKGGETRGRLLSDILNETVQRSGKYDPTGLAGEATVAHENDMEGCLVVVAKQGNDLARARVVYVETLAHNHFLKYTATAAEGAADVVRLEDQHPQLYVEPKGHGIEAYLATEKQGRKGLLRYSYDGHADAPTTSTETANYDLLPLLTTLWAHARQGVGETYGLATDYGRVSVTVVLTGAKTQARQVQLGKLGSAFLGLVGGHNMARPPWGWVDVKERNEQLRGAWFFDPARTVKRHFNLGGDFSVAYVWQPFLGIGTTAR